MKRGGIALLLSLLFLTGVSWGQVVDTVRTQGGVGARSGAPDSVSTTVTTKTTTTTSMYDEPSARPAKQGMIGLGPIMGVYKSSGADARFTGGAALRLKLAPALGVEGSITYREAQYANGAVTARSWPIMVTGLIYPLPMLYGAVGAGWYNTTLEVSAAPDHVVSGVPTLTGSETQQRFGWHFGGGVELPLGGVSLIGDLRYVFLDYDWKNLPGTSGTNANFYVISAGLLFGL